MVLHPLPSGERDQRQRSPISAWQAVERRQRQPAQEWWLVTQADHAALAGDLAARLELPGIPALSSEVIRAMAAHDAGWAQFDNDNDDDDDVEAAASAVAAVAPVSFLAIAPSQFLIAWTDSIKAAETVTAIGGIIVSEHFSRLARSRLASGNDVPEDSHRMKQFLSNECCRQARLRNQVQTSSGQIETLTDVLQFCDLVSLYLCCGADEPVEFPQQFGATTIGVRSEGDAFLFAPPVFGPGAALGVSARGFPRNQIGTLPFLLA